jgi:hypothetical protein
MPTSLLLRRLCEKLPGLIRHVQSKLSRPGYVLNLRGSSSIQLTEWRIRAARQLSWEDVTDVEVLPVLVRMLMTDGDLTARVIDALRRESGS